MGGLDASEKDIRLQGIGLSPGIATGLAIVRTSNLQEPLPDQIAEDQIEHEVAGLREAVARVSAELVEIAANMEELHGKEQSRIFEAHQLLLVDESVLSAVENRIREERLTASYLYHAVMREHADTLRSVEDKYLSERASDIEDVALRVLRDLDSGADPLQGPSFPHILIAEELHPSDTAEMEPDVVRAFVVEHGSPTSHVAIIARSLGLPAVAGIGNLLTLLHSGDEIIVDGETGEVVIRPSEKSFAQFAEMKSKRLEQSAGYEESRNEDATTLDGASVIVSANIELKRELEAVGPCGANGIGLYRTEFLFLNQSAPDEHYQTEYYRRAFETIAPEPVIFRTVDLGGDKTEPVAGYEEANPFLGWRGIRYSLDREDAFRTQLRGLLRGATGYRAGIMFPLIATVEEVREAKRILSDCQKELEAEGVGPPQSLEIGAMIEVPSAALIADAIAAEVDFLSIGTNDLVQYTTAVDRVNDRVANRFQPFHPAVIRLIVETVEAGDRAGIWTGVCGEMASDVVALPLLLGAGVDELSMVTTAVPRVKFAIRQLDAAQCSDWLLEGRKSWTTAGEIEKAAKALAQEAYPELFR